MTRKVCKHLNRDDVVTLKRLQSERERERAGGGARACESVSDIYICLIPLAQIHGRSLSWLDTGT
jgi:hypothetical protein